jgi:hypothetical protein
MKYFRLEPLFNERIAFAFGRSGSAWSDKQTFHQALLQGGQEGGEEWGRHQVLKPVSHIWNLKNICFLFCFITFKLVYAVISRRAAKLSRAGCTWECLLPQDLLDTFTEPLIIFLVV